MRIFWSFGRVIQLKKLNGSPCHTSVIRTHSEQTLRPTEFPKNSEAVLVSVDRNSSMGGVVVGILVVWLKVAMGAGWHRCSISTNEPIWRGLDAAALGGLPSEYQ